MRTVFRTLLAAVLLTPASGCEAAVAPIDAPSTDLRLELTPSASTVVAGDTLRLTIRVTNRGGTQVTDVYVKDSLPAGLRYGSHAVSQGTYRSEQGLWAVGAVPRDSSRAMTLIVYADTSLRGTTVSVGAAVFSSVFRDTLAANDTATFRLSVTSAVPAPAPPDPTPPPPVPPVPGPVPPAGVVFASSWNTATGNSPAAVTDGGAWNDHYSCSRSDVLSVVSGAALGWSRSSNILRVTEVGNGACGAVQRTQVVPVSTTHWGRMYFRNDETTQNNSFHNFSYRFVGSIQLIWFNRRATAQGFELDVRMPAAYPLNIWRLQSSVGTNPSSPPLIHLRNGTWYRYEWQLEYVSATRVRFWPRVYSEAGVLLHDAANFYQVDAPVAGTATLASWYAAGNSFAVADLQLIRDIGVGNEGRATDTRPGQSWYIANFAISTTGWLGQ